MKRLALLSFNQPEKILWALILCGLAPALFYHFVHSINYDIAWLAIAAQRLMAGGTMLKDAFETNPPLSLIFMMPPAALAALTPLLVYFCTTLYSTLIIAASIWAVRGLLRRLDFLNDGDVFIISAAYLVAMIVFPTIDYGERDHLVFAGLFPFLLWQITITFKKPVPPPLSWPVAVCGVILVLIKPHFGLLPTLMLIHRAVYQRRLFTIMCDYDFAALATGVLVYIGVILAFFPDYPHEVLPAALSLYIAGRESLTEQTLFYAGMIGVFGFTYMFLPTRDKARHRFTLFLFAVALLCLVPYYVQGKNYWYQLVPALVTSFMAFWMFIRTIFTAYLPAVEKILLNLFAAGIIGTAYFFMPLNTLFPTHGDIKNLPLTQRVANCAEPCSFFIFNNNVGIIHPTAVYAHRTHASRFPALWFLPGILDRLEDGTPDAEALRNRYTAMVGEDFARYKPRLVFIGQFHLRKDGSGPAFDFPAFFSSNPTFAAAWKAYRHTGSITLTTREYYDGTAMANDEPQVFEIYERNP